MRRARWVVASSLVVLATACSDGGDTAAPPSESTVATGPPTTPSTETTTTTAAPDPFAIPADPADIDEAYVQRVVDAIFEVEALAAAEILEEREITPQALEYLRGVWTGEELDRAREGWRRTLANPELLSNRRPGPGNQDVQRILGQAEDCVYAEARRDYLSTTVNPPPPAFVYLGLTTRAQGDDPGQHNPTPWMMFQAGTNADGSLPEDPCAGR